MAVPLFNLSRAERRIAEDLDRRWAKLREGTAFVGGAEVKEFEAAWARFLADSDCRRAEGGHKTRPYDNVHGPVGCVGVANGTDAIELALRALGVGEGDEVLVPAYTFVATASAVALAGAVPVMVDVEASTLNLDFERAEELVGERTVGVVGVHLYGNPFDLDRASEFCSRQGLWLVEDAAQAHGARWCVGEGPCAPPVTGDSHPPRAGDEPPPLQTDGTNSSAWQRVGTFGALTTWSFYPSKNLGCFGDGGAVTGGDPELLERVRKLADHGRIEHYWHGMVGRNSRLDGLQAAVLNCRLPLLDEDNARRRQVAARYRQAIAGLDSIEALAVDERAEPVYHQFTVKVSGEGERSRDRVKERLAEAGIGTAIHYPAALNTQPLWKDRAEVVRGRYPEAERAAREVLCLPMFPEITDEEVAEVVEALARVLASG